MSHSILNLILKDVKKLLQAGQTPHFVFDLDSTLFCVSPRTEQILREFADLEPVKARYPEASELLKNAYATPKDWGIRSILERSGIKENISFFNAIREHWIEKFFSSHHLHNDEPYKGALEFVKHVHDLGGIVKYLTGRDRETMEEGTILSLNAHGFPLIGSNYLNMKPDKSHNDAEFKLRYFEQFTPEQHSITWFFENEPVIIDAVERSCPELNIVFVKTVHSGRGVEPRHLPFLEFEWEFLG